MEHEQRGKVAEFWVSELTPQPAAASPRHPQLPECLPRANWMVTGIKALPNWHPCSESKAPPSSSLQPNCSAADPDFVCLPQPGMQSPGPQIPPSALLPKCQLPGQQFCTSGARFPPVMASELLPRCPPEPQLPPGSASPEPSPGLGGRAWAGLPALTNCLGSPARAGQALSGPSDPT